MRNSLLPIVSLVSIAAFLIFLFSELRRQVARDLAEKRRKARLEKLAGGWIDPTGHHPGFMLENETLVWMDGETPVSHRIEVLNDTLILYRDHSIDPYQIVDLSTDALILERAGEEVAYVRIKNNIS
jgi:hypothetical protein